MVTLKPIPDVNGLAVCVLVIEDEVLIRHAISEELRDLGTVVIEASTAEEAWAILSTGTAVDLVFSDIRLPGPMTGRQLARKIQSGYPHIPVVLTSGGLNAVQMGQAFLLKPYVMDETAAHLTELAKSAKQFGSAEHDEGSGRSPG